MDQTPFSNKANPIEDFGTLPNGGKVKVYELKNKNGISMRVLDYGATIQSLKIPLASGEIDIVLGFDSIDDYVGAVVLPAPPHFGAAIGRYSGRIKNGKFTIGTKEYQLNKNNGPNTLHGGIKGFDKVMWDIVSLSENGITLNYISPDGDENFPGILDVLVSYTLSDSNELILEYRAQASQDTIVNMTQHSYFNLDGQTGNVLDQQLFVNSDTILEIDDQHIPTGRLINASDKQIDFSQPGNVPEKIDDSYVISNKTAPVAILKSNKNKLQLTVNSDQPSVHIYVGGDLYGKFKGKNNTDYHSHSGICFESQNYPDAPNHASFPSSLVSKGGTYSQRTVWKFDF